MESTERNQFSSFEELECYNLEKEYEKYNGTKVYCPATYDGFICWPYTAVFDTAQIPCPDFNNGTIDRYCFKNDSAEYSKYSAYWGAVEYSNCSIDLKSLSLDVDTILEFLDEMQNTTFGRWERSLRITSTVGYGTSFITLVIAIGIFLTHRRLQNVRTKMHIHLFFSLLMKAFTWIVQDCVFHAPRVLFPLISFQIFINRNGTVAINMKKKWLCSTLMILIRYFEMASFCWVLMEGWYLHQLICYAPHKENISLKLHIILGWGMPIILIIPWLTIHMLVPPPLEVCLIDENDTTYYALAVPIFLTVMLNFGIFINMIRVLFVKMKFSHTLQRKEMQYKKWVKSSLTLIPLFGAYNILFGAYPFVESESKDLFMYAVTILSSIQGIFVTFLFCFLNKEVQIELKRSLRTKNLNTRFNLFKISNGNTNRDSNNTNTTTASTNTNSNS